MSVNRLLEEEKVNSITVSNKKVVDDDFKLNCKFQNVNTKNYSKCFWCKKVIKFETNLNVLTN